MTFMTGTLDSSGTWTAGIANATLPGTLTFTSTATSRKLELSQDGINFYTPTYDVQGTTAAQIIVAFNAPCAQARFAGTPGDVWILR